MSISFGMFMYFKNIVMDSEFQLIRYSSRKIYGNMLM